MLSRTLALFRNTFLQADTRRKLRLSRGSRKLAVEALEKRQLLAATDLAAIAGTVFFDTTGDGYDAGEELADVDLQLFRDDGDGVFDPGIGGDQWTQSTTTSTNPAGLYRFSGLEAGTYFVLQPAQTAGGEALDEVVSPSIVVTADAAAGTPGVTIDSFDQTQQSAVANSLNGNNPDFDVSQVAAGEALGGERDLFAFVTSGDGEIAIKTLAFNVPVLQFDSTSGVAGRRVVTWDGIDGNAEILDGTGLNGEDLTEGGNNVGFYMNIGADQLSGEVELRVYTDAMHWSSARAFIPNTGGLAIAEILMEFSDFQQGGPPTPQGTGLVQMSTIALGPADFTNVGAVQLEVINTALSVNGRLDLIGTLGSTIIPQNVGNTRIADLRLSKDVDDPTPNVGDNVTFTITVTNDGPDDATGVAVSDTLPAGLTFVAPANASQGSYSSATGIWTVGNLNNGAFATLELMARVDTVGIKTNTAQVSSANAFDPDSTPGNSVPTEDDQDDAAVTPQIADLWVNKTVDEPRPNVGDDVVFTVTVTNDGPDIATNVALSDVLPSGLSYMTYATAQGAYDNSSGTWSVGTLPVGASASLLLVATVTSPNPQTNWAQVSAADQFDIDSTPANDVPSEDDQEAATVAPLVIDLSLDKTVDDSTPNVGDIVNFTITLNNAGPDTATGVTVGDLLPTGLSLVTDNASRGSYDGVTGSWTVGTLAAGESVTLQLTATVDTFGTKSNTTEVTAADQYDIDSTPNNNVAAEDDQDTVSLTPQVADLSLIKSVDNSTPNLGDEVTFTITVTNAGPFTATGVAVSDVLPAGLTFVRTNTGPGVYDQGTGVWSLGNLAVGGSASLQVVATVDTLGTKTNVAQVSAADQFDIDSTPANSVPSEDDQDDAAVTPKSIDLSVTKTVDDSTPNVGDVVTFTVQLRNAGPNIAHNVTLRDVLPGGLAFVAANPNQGSYDSAVGIWDVGTVAVGQTLVMTLQAEVTSLSTQTNVAQVNTADEFDPDSTPGNNVPGEDDQDLAIVVPEVADLSVVKTVDDATPTVGDSVVFTITLRNDGPDPATHINVLDRLPAGLTFQSASVTRGNYNSGTGIWYMDSLAVNAEATLLLTAAADGGGTLTNVAQVWSVDQFDPDSTPGNDVPEEDDQDPADVSPRAVISGCVYVDQNHNGIKDPGEPGIGGVTLRLTGTNYLGNSVNRTTKTAGDGTYEFRELVASDSFGYRIVEVQPGAYLDGEESVGSLGGQAGSGLQPAGGFGGQISTADLTDSINQIVVVGGDNGVLYNFGEVVPAAITGRVYHDVNQDGRSQTSEPGIGGVTIVLTGTDILGNPVSETTTTSPNGAYKFEALRAADATGYAITETQPAGYKDGDEQAGTPSLNATVLDDAFTDLDLTSGTIANGFNFGEIIEQISKRMFLASFYR